MHFLGVGETCDLGALYLALKREGHAVKVAATEPLAEGTLAGLIERTPDWRGELDWIRAAGSDGVILFESVSEGFGALQDSLRADGFHVIGGSAYGDRLETDRAFAQAVLADIGLSVARTKAFEDARAALTFLQAYPGRYVLKHSGADHAAADTYVGLLADGRDVAALLRAKTQSPTQARRPLVLMRHIDGVEMGVGAYFNGERFLRPACLDWEHKRFFNGDLGELTGEMGTVATFDRSERFFGLTLARMEGRLRENGFVGYVNLNTIVNDQGVWPLEFTCRFGYPGFATLAPLQETSWGDLFARLVQRSEPRFRARPGFSVGVVITTPPFPYSRQEVDEVVGLPVVFNDDADPSCRHYGEVGLDAGGQLVTAGLYGWTMVVTGVGPTIAQAKAEAYRQVAQVAIPNARYRTDIGDRLIDGAYAEVERLGLFDDPPGDAPAQVDASRGSD